MLGKWQFCDDNTVFRLDTTDWKKKNPEAQCLNDFFFRVTDNKQEGTDLMPYSRTSFFTLQYPFREQQEVMANNLSWSQKCSKNVVRNFKKRDGSFVKGPLSGCFSLE